MGELFSENWKVFPAMLAGAVVLGLVSAMYMRDAIKRWIFNGHGGNPLTKEDHEAICGKMWEEHIRATNERWIHNQELTAKNRELLLLEISYLKQGQEKMGKTVDQIFERMERGHNL